MEKVNSMPDGWVRERELETKRKNQGTAELENSFIDSYAD